MALLARCAEIHPDLAALEDSCRRLTFYAVAVRYPGDLYEPSAEDVRPLIRLAIEIRTAILQYLPGAADGEAEIGG